MKQGMFELSQITVEELARKLAAPSEAYQFVDVREPDEIALASLPGFVNLPLSQFSE
jgi:rhodanese-related sulfurtransferase